MLNYVTIGATDFQKAMTFYNAIFSALGQERFSYEPDRGRLA